MHRNFNDPNYMRDAAAERARVTAINELGRSRLRRDVADVAIRDGWPLAEFRRALLEEIAGYGKPATEVGLSPREIEQYSVLRTIYRLGTDPTSLPPGLESEASTAVAKALKREPAPGSFFVPHEILRRDLNVGQAGAGGYLVATENVSFIGALRNRAVVYRMGASALQGLVGDASIPRQANTTTAHWLSTETSAPSQSDASFGNAVLKPKTVAAFTRLSRQLAIQASPAAEAVALRDLAASVAVAVDAAALNGSGASGQPLGITNTSGIGSVVGTSMDHAKLLEFQTDLLAANAVVNPATLGYVTTPTIASSLANRQRFTGTDSQLWAGSLLDGTVEGLRAMSSLQVPASTIIFGDWSELLIGEWGVLELASNPFQNFQAGIIGVRSMYSLDVALRHAAAFSVATNVT